MLLLFLLLLVAAIPVAAQNSYELEVRQEIDNAPAHRIEGIWLLPDQELRVWIRENPDPRRPHDETFQIIAVDSPDASIDIGEVIGHVAPTTDPVRFKLRLLTKRGLKGLYAPKKFTAILGNSDEALTLERPTFDVRFNPLAMLPYVRSLFRVSFSSARARVPYGFVRVYPSYDGNGSSRFKPRYL